MAAYDMFNDSMKGLFMKSVEFWKNKKIKIFSSEHILYTMIDNNIPLCINVLNHFKCDVNKMKNDIINGNFQPNIKNQLSSNISEISFDDSIISCIGTANNYVLKENIDDNLISTETFFLALCTSPESKLCSYFEDKGISSEIVKEYIINNNNIIDKIKEFVEDDNEEGIIGEDNSNAAIDTLEPPSEEDIKNNNNDITKAKPKKSKKSQLLANFSTDYIELVRKGKITNIIGREKETEMMMEILCRKNKSNVMLLGDPGVGKTAIVEGLALEIYNNRVPLMLRNKNLIELDISGLVAGTRFRGDFEERVKAILNELIASKNTILFIDEIHTVLGAGSSIGGLDLGNMLKPALARGDIQVIGAITSDEYSKYILTDGALERRFQTIQVKEPSIETAELILDGIRSSYEKFHNIEITDSAIEAAVRLSKQYITQRFLPDKCIDLIDIAGARSKMNTMEVPNDIKTMRLQLEKLKALKDDAARNEQYNMAANYHNKELKLQAKLEEREERYFSSLSDEKVIITDKEIAEVISRLTDIPTSKLTQDDADKLLSLSDNIKTRLIGQNSAVDSVCKSILRARTDMHDSKKPIGSFLFMGLTGIGKTELARCLAKELFGSDANLLKFDMSEYSEKFDISKLLGSAPGFVGYDEGGKLTEAIRKTPYAVLLFDEIEKAHKDIYNIFLQILDDGCVTDGKGRTVYFNNAIIIFTSNIGAQKAYNSKALGFGNKNNLLDAINIMKKELELHFRPEFLNRLDDIIAFNPLDKESISKIIDIQIDKLNERIKHRDIIFTITDNMRNHIIKIGYSDKYGARQINRAIQSTIEDYSALKLLKKEFDNGMIIEFDYIDDKITHKIIEKRKVVEKSKFNHGSVNSNISSTLDDISSVVNEVENMENGEMEEIDPNSSITNNDFMDLIMKGLK